MSVVMEDLDIIERPYITQPSLERVPRETIGIASFMSTKKSIIVLVE
jgi:hypothetical protein